MSHPWSLHGGQLPCPRSCPRRQVGCRTDCPEWQEHERKKQERYERKRLEHATERPDDMVIEQIRQKRRRGR